MAKKTASYYKRLEKRMMKARADRDRRFFASIGDVFENMLDEVESNLEGLYSVYADENGLSLTQAKNFARMTDINKLVKDIERYKRDVKTLTPEELKLLNEYELLAKINVQEFTKARLGFTITKHVRDLRKIMYEGFTQNVLDELEGQLGIYGDLMGSSIGISEGMLIESIEGTRESKWSPKLWLLSSNMTNEITHLVNQRMTQGLSYQEFAKSVRKFLLPTVKKQRYVAERIARTESSRVESTVQTELWKSSGFDSYEYIAEGGRVCDECKKLDGKVFKIKDQQRGKNMFPMHPNCRCSAVAHMGEGFDVEAMIQARQQDNKKQSKELTDVKLALAQNLRKKL